MTLLNFLYILPSETLIQRHIHRVRDDLKLRVKNRIHQKLENISPTNDAWPSRVYCGYIVVVGHLVDGDLEYEVWHRVI